ncbi:MAG: hypothetical protein JO072_04070 [Parafilimonas sp.]|nr:hypothetical protein [Parafilimonas sp.]
MSNRKACLYAVLFFVVSACSKKQFAPVPDEVTQKEILGIYDCDPAIPEFIHGSFNNTTICFNTITNASDTFNNAYYRDSSIHLDHINLIRTNTKKTMSCQIHFVNPDLRHKTLPYMLPHAQPGYNEYAEMVISDPDKLWATDITEDYVGSTYKGFSITITDTTGGYLSGTFRGEASTRHGKKVEIENGTFYVHVIDVNKN